jgi:hypothetical protein
MKSPAPLVVVAALFCAAMTATDATAQQAPLSPAEIAKIKADVVDATQAYVRIFSARDAKGVSEKVFSNPAIAIGPNGVTVITPEKQLATYQDIFQNLAKTQYDRSEYPNPNVCVLNANAAIVSGKFYRYNKDGSLLLKAGLSYLYARTQDGWKAVATLLLDNQDKVVRCD